MVDEENHENARVIKMSMYEIPPLVPDDLEIKPAEVMYFVPSYHAMKNKKEPIQNCNDICDDSYDPVKEVEKKQQALIQSLMKSSSKDKEKCAKTALTTSLASPPSKDDGKKDKDAKAPVSKSDGKKDKDAKKEARKAARVEAKSKRPSIVMKSSFFQHRPITESIENFFCSEKDLYKTVCSKGTRDPWLVHLFVGGETNKCDDWTVSNSHLPPVLCNFERQKLGDISITVTSIDELWDASTTVNVSQGDNFSLVSSKLSLNCRVSSWKLLGSALGIFSFAPNHAIHAAHQHRWLSQVDMVLSGGIPKEEVVREASRFLSQFDALGSQFEFGIADVIAKSVLIGSSNTSLPNNVELWSKRLESAV
ncbi:hypothetical protein KIN20_031406 [Parelaphostrongylus tenuis]|uniref:Uncharacterized protein n=1 Tax=Parelaphostrongylus tenuis TaxID=148309 RepID=A0AAD5WGZ6_PARTN|nr:hypothetical protein KIN20_031406 [Parelaphostrongylus tenuis]